MAVKILHKRSAVQFKSATSAQLELGELGLNYHESGPYLQCKDAAGEVVQLGGVYVGSGAPGNTLKGAWWLRDTDDTLFLYDGTSWVEIAGGSGGGGGSVNIIGADGIEVATSGTTYTVSVDLASPANGLAFAGGKLRAEIATTSSLGVVSIGSGIDVNTAGEISVDLSGVDVNADLDYVPNGNNAGTVTNTAGDDATIPIATNTVAGLFTGDEKQKLDGLNTNATNDGKYLRVDAGAPDQTRASGKVTFSDLTTHAEGVKITGGTIDPTSANGEIAYGTDPSGLTNTLQIKGANTGQWIRFYEGGLQVFGDNKRSGFAGGGLYAGTEYGPNNTGMIAFAETCSYTNVSGAANKYGFDADPINLSFQAGDTGFYRGFSSKAPKDTTSGKNLSWNFYGETSAPNFFAGDTYIGGSTARSTRELWESTLTEEQKEQLAAGTLAIPANVSVPGDGSFVRQWWYDQQSAEDQALIDSGELEYPERYQAANFVDTFDLGENTNINLIANEGRGEFGGGVSVTGGSTLGVGNGLTLGGDGSLGVVAGSSKVIALNQDPRYKISFTPSVNAASGNYGYGILFIPAVTNSTFAQEVDLLRIQPNLENLTTETVAYNSAAYLSSTTRPTAVKNVYAYAAENSIAFGTDRSIGFYSQLLDDGDKNFNFYAEGDGINYFRGEVRGGGIDGANHNWVIRSDGSTSPFNIELQMESDNPAAFQTTYSTDEEGNQVENTSYIGNSESLLAIIKDLRVRVAALEAA